MSEDVHTDGEVLMDVTNNYDLQGASCCFLSVTELKGSVKEPNISVYFFFCPSLNGVLFLIFCLLMEGECQILVF